MNFKINLLDFINTTSSPFHVVEKCCTALNNNGFTELDFSSNWNLKNNNAYYTIPYGTTMFAFTIGDNIDKDTVMHVASAHTDYPCFRIKPNPELIEKDYLKINTEAYGGLILNTWLDRPLSIAGKVSLKSDSVYNPTVKLVDFNRPLLTIPNLAIHINKEINKGIALNKQTDLAPILGMINDTLDKDHFFINMLAIELNVSPKDILDFDLYIYNYESGCNIGINNDFISAPRLDNVTSVIALINGLLDSKASISSHNHPNSINIIALYDNEEVGSRSKQGADSIITSILLEKIYTAIGMNKIDLYNSMLKSFLLSVDVSHGFHPNYSAKYDPTNISKLNGGVVLKLDSTQKYASDTEAIAAVQQLCNAYNIPYQKFTNRSDMTSGSTLGSIASSWTPMKTVDLGVPLLAMHSARELAGAKDQISMEKLLSVFFLTC